LGEREREIGLSLLMANLALISTNPLCGWLGLKGGSGGDFLLLSGQRWKEMQGDGCGETVAER
jgi:hypothetical protein